MSAILLYYKFLSLIHARSFLLNTPIFNADGLFRVEYAAPAVQFDAADLMFDGCTPALVLIASPGQRLIQQVKLIHVDITAVGGRPAETTLTEGPRDMMLGC